jgi:hypothetical protein
VPVEEDKKETMIESWTNLRIAAVILHKTVAIPTSLAGNKKFFHKTIGFKMSKLKGR